MSGKELYEEGLIHLNNGIRNTEYTHIHSEDIRANIVKDYFLPSAKLDYPLAIKEVASYLISIEDYQNTLFWVVKYKEVTNCSKTELIKLFGTKAVIGYALHL